MSIQALQVDGQQQRMATGSDLLYIAELGCGITRRTLLQLRAVGKCVVSKSADDERFQVYIDIANDGRYFCSGEFSQCEANQLVVRLTNTIAAFVNCNVVSNVPMDESGREVDVKRVRMVTLPGLVGAAMVIEDIARIHGLTLRTEGSNAFVDVRWDHTTGRGSISFKINDEGCTSALMVARRAEQVFAEVVSTMNKVQLAMGMHSLLKVTPVGDDDDAEPAAAPASESAAGQEGLG